MNLVELYKTQSILDDKITERLKDVYDTGSYQAVDNLIYGFHTEVHELANEIGFFKFWKQSHEMDSSDTLEELVDCIHILLSIGLKVGYDRVVKEVEAFPLWEDYSILELFKELRHNDLDTVGRFTLAFSLILGIAKKLDFTELELQAAYRLKNDENHSRQEDGY